MTVQTKKPVCVSVASWREPVCFIRRQEEAGASTGGAIPWFTARLTPISCNPKTHPSVFNTGHLSLLGAGHPADLHPLFEAYRCNIEAQHWLNCTQTIESCYMNNLNQRIGCHVALQATGGCCDLWRSHPSDLAYLSWTKLPARLDLISSQSDIWSINNSTLLYSE